MIKKGTQSIGSVFKGSTEISKVLKGTILVYESWKTLTATGTPPLVLANCKNTNLLDYRIYGNSVQVKNLYTNKFTTLNSQITVGENGWLNLNITTSGFKNFNSNPSIEILPNTIYTVILETSADYSDSGNTYLSVNSTPTGSSDIPQFTTTWANTLSANQKYKILLTSSENPQETGKVMLRSYFGNTAGNTVTGAIRISLIKGNIDVNNFVYDDYILSPSNPIEVGSVGDKSKNLLDISNFTTQTVTGVTYTNNGDGTITINGTATGWGQLNFTNIGKTLTGINGVASFVSLSGSYSGETSTYPRAVFIAPSNSAVAYPVLNSSNNYTFTSDKSINRFSFQHTTGNVFNNLVVGLQVEEGSVHTSFEPGNKYKIPITVSGKNRFNINEPQITNPKGNYYTPIVTVDGSTLKLKARNINAIQPAYFHCDVGEGSQVTLRVSGILGEGAGTTNSRVRYSFTNDINDILNGNIPSGHLSNLAFSSTEVKTYAKTVTATGRYMLVAICIQSTASGLSTATGEFTNIQVEYSDASTDYESYVVPNTINQTKYNETYNQSKDSTVMFDSNGNRIYPEDDMISIPSTDSIVYCSQYLATPDDATIQNYMVFYDENKNPISNADVTIEYINCPTFRYLGGYPQFMVVEGHKNQTNIWKVKANNSAIKYMIMGCRNTTSTVTSYASNRYIGIEHDYNIYLNEPLRKIGDFADYLDYKNGKVVRNINRKTMTSSEYTENYTNNSLYAWQTQKANPYGHTSSTLPNANNIVLTKSNMFNGDTWENMYFDRNKGTKILVANNGKNLNYIYLQNFTSATDLKTFLQNNAGVLYVDYVLATPIEESITLPNILLNKGTNVIDVDTTIKPSNMYVEYKGKVG